MSVIDKLHKKHLEWSDDPDNDPPNSIVFPIADFIEFEIYLSELERNESLPLTWLRNIQVFASKGATEIKVGRLV